jgi:hypothetical protein
VLLLAAFELSTVYFPVAIAIVTSPETNATKVPFTVILPVTPVNSCTAIV